MVRVNKFISVAALFGIARAAHAPKKSEYEDLCPSAPEIVIVQDSSGSLREVGEELTKKIKDTILEWKEGFPGEVKLGFTSFTDKPLPLRGWGHQNYYTNYVQTIPDFCYDFGTGLTHEPEEIEKAYANMKWRNGGDLPEAQYEALLYAALDPAMNWTPKGEDKDEEGRKISKIAVVITDDISHTAGDAFLGISHYNSPFSMNYKGGWGSPTLPSFPAAVYMGEEPWTLEEYAELSDLVWELAHGYDLEEDDQEMYNYYADIFGPDKFAHVPQHDGKFNLSSCAGRDYVTMSQLQDALAVHGVTPVFLVTMPKNGYTPEVQKECIEKLGFTANAAGWLETEDEKLECIKRYYEVELKRYGISAFVESFKTPEDVVDTLKAIVLKAADFSCKETTTPEPPTTTTSTETPTTTTTETPTPPTPTTGTTTTPAVIPPVVPPADGDKSEGSNIGVIAGAAGGAVAGVAILGGILYKTIGGGLFGGNKTPDLEAMEQVETPDTPVEREAMEEVTIDMFQ